MHGPHGDFSNTTVYEEIVRTERTVHSHSGGFRSTVTFTPRGERTELSMRNVFESAAARDLLVAKYSAIEGGKQTLGRLAEHVRAPGPELRMTRILNAPRSLVFEAWTKPEHVARWFTPAPLTTPSCEIDFRTGGVFRLVMQMPNGVESLMETVLGVIVPLERIDFSGKMHDGNYLSTTVTFADTIDGKTSLTVHQVYSFASDTTGGAHQGWTETLSQLEEGAAALGRASKGP